MVRSSHSSPRFSSVASDGTLHSKKQKRVLSTAPFAAA